LVGDLGQRGRRATRQAPEGFYRITRNQMNPNSQFHLAFNLGYPIPTTERSGAPANS